jgi:hypothetical protein
VRDRPLRVPDAWRRLIQLLEQREVMVPGQLFVGSNSTRSEPPSGLTRALDWQRQLDSGAVASRVAIARREGISRARVTQLLNRLERAAERKLRA